MVNLYTYIKPIFLIIQRNLTMTPNLRYQFWASYIIMLWIMILMLYLSLVKLLLLIFEVITDSCQRKELNTKFDKFNNDKSLTVIDFRKLFIQLRAKIHIKIWTCLALSKILYWHLMSKLLAKLVNSLTDVRSFVPWMLSFFIKENVN